MPPPRPVWRPHLSCAALFWLPACLRLRFSLRALLAHPRASGRHSPAALFPPLRSFAALALPLLPPAPKLFCGRSPPPRLLCGCAFRVARRPQGCSPPAAGFRAVRVRGRSPLSRSALAFRSFSFCPVRSSPRRLGVPGSQSRPVGFSSLCRPRSPRFFSVFGAVFHIFRGVLLVFFCIILQYLLHNIRILCTFV